MNAQGEHIRQLVEQLKSASPLQSPKLAAEIARSIDDLTPTITSSAKAATIVQNQVADATSALAQITVQMRRHAPAIQHTITTIQSDEVVRAIHEATNAGALEQQVALPAFEAIEQLRRSGVLEQIEHYQRLVDEIANFVKRLDDMREGSG
jgi:hypothetical protein